MSLVVLDLVAMARCRAVLLKLLHGEVVNTNYGVCFNLTYTHPPEHTKFIGAFEHDWYEFVSEQSEDFPGAERYSTGKLKDWFLPHHPGFGLWEGPNLEQRKALIRHLLGKLAVAEAALTT